MLKSKLKIFLVILVIVIVTVLALYLSGTFTNDTKDTDGDTTQTNTNNNKATDAKTTKNNTDDGAKTINSDDGTKTTNSDGETNAYNKKYTIKIMPFGAECAKYPISVKYLKMTVNNKDKPEFCIFRKDLDNIYWYFDKMNRIYTKVNNKYYYMSKSILKIGSTNYYTYNKLTSDIYQALVVNINNKNQLTTLKPVLYGDIYPGNGDVEIFKNDTCDGYYIIRTEVD